MLSRRFSGFVPLLKNAQNNKRVPLINRKTQMKFFFSTASRPGAQKM
jgi:hypothetical protein